MRHKLCRLIFIITAFAINGSSVWAFEFIYKFNAGDKYRIVSSANQDIYVDRVLSYRAEIINRIAVEVKDAIADNGRLLSTFQSAEKTVPVSRENTEESLFQWSMDYQTEFEQDKLGFMTVGAQYFMPVVRDAPVFPGRALNPGDTWNADGLEVHDFRDSFGIDQPYRIPFTASYTYLGERSWKGKAYPAFFVSYRIFFEPAFIPGRVYPMRIQAASDQTVFWDSERGQALAYEGHFRTIFDLSDGQTWEYRGRSEAEVVDVEPMDKEEMARSIAGEIAEIPDVSVRISGDGVVIVLENIIFAQDSAVLMQSELRKLDSITSVLMNHSDRDILVGGHTSPGGTAAVRNQLSLDRAASVAEYLLRRNVRTSDRILVRGFGSDQPIADNSTFEGMARNRRVEITLLEN